MARNIARARPVRVEPRSPSSTRDDACGEDASDTGASDTGAKQPPARRTLGSQGEEYACRYLESLGYRILETNWRCHEGEIDIVALDGREIVVVEVKTRRSTRFGPAVEAVTHEKHLRLRRLAVLWMREHEAHAAVRLDVVGIELSQDGPRVDHRVRVIL